MPQGVPNTWWRQSGELGQNLIHFCCGVCYKERAIPAAWEVASVPELQRRAEFSRTGLIICDPCWPTVRARTIPKVTDSIIADDSFRIVPPEGHNLKMPAGTRMPGHHA